jgi:hypothetical protein
MKTSKILKHILFFSGIGILLLVALFIFMFYKADDPSYLKLEFINNFNNHQTEILELKTYFNSIVPSNKRIQIEFEDDGKISFIQVISFDPATGDTVRPILLDWDLKLNSDKVNSFIKTIGWTQETLKTLKQRLDKANCDRIESGEPTKIGSRQGEMGTYSYNIFDKPISDSLKNRYNERCTFIVYNDKLVLELNASEFGPQCFSKN